MVGVSFVRHLPAIKPILEDQIKRSARERLPAIGRAIVAPRPSLAPDACAVKLVSLRVRQGLGECLDLPRFRGEVRSWDQGIWFDGILSSSFE